MRGWKKVPAWLAWIGLLLPSFVLAGAQPVTGSGTDSSSAQQLVARAQPSSLDGVPDSPGAIYARRQETAKPQSNPSALSGPDDPAKPQTAKPEAQPPSQTSVSSPQRPVGTAAAGPSKVSGVAASQPAGVAIAPAKQRRVRTILLRMGAIAGGGVAVGTVWALSRSTPSKPSGAK